MDPGSESGMTEEKNSPDYLFSRDYFFINNIFWIPNHVRNDNCIFLTTIKIITTK